MNSRSKIHRQLPLLPATWNKLDRIRARSQLRFQLASRAEVLEEIVNRLPEDYTL